MVVVVLLVVVVGVAMGVGFTGSVPISLSAPFFTSIDFMQLLCTFFSSSSDEFYSVPTNSNTHTLEEIEFSLPKERSFSLAVDTLSLPPFVVDARYRSRWRSSYNSSLKKNSSLSLFSIP